MTAGSDSHTAVMPPFVLRSGWTASIQPSWLRLPHSRPLQHKGEAAGRGLAQQNEVA